MSERATSYELRGRAARIVAAAAFLPVIAFAWTAVRWQIGNMLGEITPPSSPDVIEIAEAAGNLSPHDPAVKWLLATSRYNPSDMRSIEAYAESLKDVVRMAPADYRWWVELGRAYEQSGQAMRAREALSVAVSVNRGYAYPAWQLGNFELRSGDADRGVAELVRSAKLSSVYRDQVFPVLWDFFDRDASRLDSVTGADSEMLSALTKFYASKELADEAVSAWSRMDPAQRQDNMQIGLLVARALFEKRYFRASAEMLKTLGTEPEAVAGMIVNGGFESEVTEKKETLFGWYLVKKDKVDVRQDRIVKRSGQGSLRMGFKGFNGAELTNLFQYFAVDSDATYRLTVAVRTEGLKSEAPVTVDVAGVQSANLRKTEVVPGTLASAEIPSGTGDWKELVLDFTVPPGVQGLQVRVNRISCGDACPIVGTLWLDDVVLQRTK